MTKACKQCGAECNDNAKFCNQCGEPFRLSAEELVDPLYDDAVEFVLQAQHASVSLVQRMLQIDYNRASSLLHAMESNGIVSPKNEVGQRKILVLDQSDINQAEPSCEESSRLSENDKKGGADKKPASIIDHGDADTDKYINDAFSGLVGMKSVLDEINRQNHLFKIDNMRAALGQNVAEPPSRHMVFLGPPGTGKTTVARIIAGLYHRLGLLATDKVVETDRAGLVGEYLGETPSKTMEVLKSALGGVLFIDEAYALVGDSKEDYGYEAITTLLKFMEDHRHDLVVIVAGYEKEMNSFLEANTGLASRFSRKIYFPNYTPEELFEIFEQRVKADGMVLENGLAKRIKPVFARDMRSQRERFGNARYVRTLFDQVRQAQADRLVIQGITVPAELQNISVEDVESALGEQLPEQNSLDKSIDQILEKLNCLVGLAKVKEQIADLVDFVHIQRERTESGMKAAEGFSLHLVFSGNPGTGKTTVARIVADIYFALGLIPSNRLLEVDRSGLVASYVGQTAPKTQSVVDKALGGVLFIDEAYSLTPREPSGSDFGNEAIDTLLKAMEDFRSEFVVIVAGYKDRMQEFIGANPGLQSRFNSYIEFEDYTPPELLEIFLSRCSDLGMVLQDDAQQWLLQWLNMAHQKGRINGNGRFARNIFERCIHLQARRLARLHSPTKKELGTLTRDDVNLAVKDMH